MPTLNEPVYAAILIDKIRAYHEQQGPKPHAFDTPFRHSGGGDCGLALGLKYSGVPESDPLDEPSMWLTWLGTTVHEEWQEACDKVLACVAELAVHDDDMLASGSLDLFHAPRGSEHSVTVEAKIVNGSKFNRAIGIIKSGPKSRWKPAGGPGAGHVIQLALNTIGANSDYGVIFYLSTEAVSKGIQNAVNANCDRQMSDMDRFIAEWTYTKEELAPIASAELDRLGQIMDTVDAGRLPEPYAVGDDFEPVRVDPNAEYPSWQCDYCSYLSVCPVANGQKRTESELFL